MIFQAYKDAFEAGAITSFQQMRTLFSEYCIWRDSQSQNHRFLTNEGITMATDTPAGTPVARFGRRAGQTYNDIDFGQVWVGLKRGYANSTVEEHDTIQYDGQVNLPMVTMREHGYAAHRWVDDRIIAAITGGRIGNQKTAVALPAAQKKAVTLVGSNKAQLDSEQLATDILQTFAAANATGPTVIAISPAIIPLLYAVDEYKNMDYTRSANLAANRLGTDYILPEWMGMTWICSTRLLMTNSNKTVTCPVWHRGNVAFKENKPFSTMIAVDPTKKGNPMQYTSQRFGDATRILDKGVIEYKMTVSE